MIYIFGPLLFVSIVAAAVVVARGRNSNQDRFWGERLDSPEDLEARERMLDDVEDRFWKQGFND